MGGEAGNEESCFHACSREPALQSEPAASWADLARCFIGGQRTGRTTEAPKRDAAFDCHSGSGRSGVGSPALLSKTRQHKQKKAPALTAGALKVISQAENYFSILETTPEPTVWPPSRIAKRMPSSMATGVISSTCISTLSPGMHISVPSGRVMMPVTSVVRK